MQTRCAAWFLSLGCFLVLSSAAAAQVPEGATALTPLDQYRTDSFTLRFSLWSGMKLARNGVDQELGYFGRHGDTLFAGSEAALDDISSFRGLRIAGTLTYVAGTVLIVATMVMLFMDAFANVGDDRLIVDAAGNPKALFFGLVIPGTVSAAAGGIMIQVANAYLSDAVEHYNGDLYQRLRGAPATPAPAPSLALRLRARF